jgi:U3 small nucleolar RNA-associated protein 13
MKYVDSQRYVPYNNTSYHSINIFQDSTAVTALAITPDGKHLATVSSSLSIRIYSLPPPLSPPFANPLQPIRTIPKAHDAPVHLVSVDPTSNYLATGSADGVVKVWDIHRGFVTHVFKGHGGIISALTFHLCRSNEDDSGLTTQRLLLATGSVDTRLRIFDLTSSTSRATNAKPLLVLEGHVSVPRGLAFSADDRWLISGGRDAVVLVWDLQNCLQPNSQTKKRSFLAKTIPILERVEALGIIEVTEDVGSSTGASKLRFYTGGEKGVVRIWDAKDNQVLAAFGEEHSEKSEDVEEQLSILDIIYAPGASTLVSIHADQNILFHSLQSLSLSRQLVGFNDEIVDAILLTSDSAGRDTHLAIATNSPLIRIYSLSASSGLDARLISGHGDTVLALSYSQDQRIFASGSKDKSTRIWAPLADGSGVWGCIAVCEGHAESVGALAMSHNWGEKGRFLFTGSQDRTVKMWDLDALPLTCPLPPSAEGAFEPLRPRSLLTQKTHDKDINSLDVSPNDKLLATGSQDKTAKIFEIDVSSRGASIKLMGTLKGHKRGIWNVKFSRTDRVVATASGDKSIKLWNLEDFSCVKVGLHFARARL